MSAAIPESFRTRFEREGVVYPIPVLSPEKISFYLTCFLEIEDLLGRPIKRMGNPALHFSWAYRLATESPVLDAVEEILGSDLLISGTLIFCKYPHDPAFVAWHQDTFYSNLDLTPSVSAWIALLDSTSENGCMRVVPGSHLQGTLIHQETRAPDNLLRRGEEIQVDVKEADAIDLVLSAGEMSLHHHAIIHGSRPNRYQTAWIHCALCHAQVRSRSAANSVPAREGKLRLRAPETCRAASCSQHPGVLGSLGTLQFQLKAS